MLGKRERMDSSPSVWFVESGGNNMPERVSALQEDRALLLLLLNPDAWVPSDDERMLASGWIYSADSTTTRPCRAQVAAGR